MSAYKFRFHTASKKILGDLITPVSAYLKVRDAYPQSGEREILYRAPPHRKCQHRTRHRFLPFSRRHIRETHYRRLRHSSSHQRIPQQFQHRGQRRELLRTVWLHDFQRGPILREHRRQG